MQLLEKNNKGFSVLEVIVVLAIIGVISAVAYPDISHWVKARKINSAAVKINTIFLNINAQVQRGLFGFVQVHVNSGDDTVVVTTKGMTNATLGEKISSVEDFRKKITARCKTEDGYWDEDGSLASKPEVMSVEFDTIALSFKGEAAVCFSKDGRWYSADGNFINGDDPVSAMYICEKSIGSCTDDEGVIDVEIEYLYAVSWSRFGNIKLEKYNPKIDAWIHQ